MPRLFASAAVSGVLLVVCAATLAAGSANLWLDVPFVAQPKDGCGAASISMVMQYWDRQQAKVPGPEADPDRVMHALYSPLGHGIRASAIEQYFNANGFRTFAITADWTEVAHELSQGRPLIAALKPPSQTSLHYVVVAGIDERESVVLVNDPAQRKLLKEDRVQFDREWKAAGYWALLAVPQTSAH